MLIVDTLDFIYFFVTLCQDEALEVLRLICSVLLSTCDCACLSVRAYFMWTPGKCPWKRIQTTELFFDWQDKSEVVVSRVLLLRNDSEFRVVFLYGIKLSSEVWSGYTCYLLSLWKFALLLWFTKSLKTYIS